MGLIVTGINHTTAPVELREKLCFDEASAKAANQKLIHSNIVEEAVTLSTCNRTEIYGYVHDSAHLNGQLSKFITHFKIRQSNVPENLFYQKEDSDAVNHLFRVAAGLDSMVIGENQILAQVKQAYSLATESCSTGATLNKLFHSSFRTGKRVRTETRIGEGSISVASTAIDLAKKIFQDISGKKILLIGAGEMAIETLSKLNSCGIHETYIINRTMKRAATLAKKFGAKVFPYDEILSALGVSDIVITSTAASDPILTPDMVRNVMGKRKNRPVFLIDISVPRNIHPDVKEIYNAFLYDIDDLQAIVKENIGNRRIEIPKAEKIVTEESKKFMDWLKQKPAIYTIRQIQEHFESIREEELHRNRKYFKEEDWEQMDKFSKTLMKKFLRSPIMRVKSCSDKENLCERCTVKEVLGLESDS
ncbi:glutamyl-tRNA reductase [candidate division KSB1 bacterium]|nr:glutamyl-tRNA reductase [candidate division KSB1 bacterium]